MRRILFISAKTFIISFYYDDMTITHIRLSPHKIRSIIESIDLNVYEKMSGYDNRFMSKNIMFEPYLIGDDVFEQALVFTELHGKSNIKYVLHKSEEFGETHVYENALFKKTTIERLMLNDNLDYIDEL